MYCKDDNEVDYNPFSGGDFTGTTSVTVNVPPGYKDKEVSLIAGDPHP